jgi:tRNA pseudouridine55 synthase
MNGFISVYKPKGYSSNKVVQAVKRKNNFRKVGHLGTLDPMAQGLLVLAINRATKFSSYFLNSNKSYMAKVQIGTSTDTDDAEGKVIKTSAKSFSKKEVEAALMSFIGKQFQEPPYFSALKHKGKPMYKYAREGEFIKKDPREIEIFSIENYDLKKNVCSFDITCSKGTYIRSIARDLGIKLESAAHLIFLERTKQDIFSIDMTVDVDDCSDKSIMEIDKAFSNLKSLKLDPMISKKFTNGARIEYKTNPDGVYKVYNFENIFLGLGSINNKILKSKQLV